MKTQCRLIMKLRQIIFKSLPSSYYYISYNTIHPHPKQILKGKIIWSKNICGENIFSLFTYLFSPFIFLELSFLFCPNMCCVLSHHKCTVMNKRFDWTRNKKISGFIEGSCCKVCKPMSHCSGQSCKQTIASGQRK